MTPAEELRAAATTMNADADAVEAEMTMHPGYWGTEVSDAAYAKGVDNGLGGIAGAVAGKWTPGQIRAVADWLDAEAERADSRPDLLLHSLSPGPLAVARAYLGAGDPR